MAAKSNKKASLIATAIIIVVVLAGLAAWSAFGAGSASQAASLKAVVHDGDGNTHEMDLSQDAQQTLTTSLGSNTVVVSAGKVHVEEADCPNHDCMRQGEIDTPGQQIVCLPHKLWIEVVAQGGASGQVPSSIATAQDDDSFDVESR